MATLEAIIPDDFIKTLARLEDSTGEIIPKVLEAGADPLVEEIRESTANVVGRDTKYPSQSIGLLAASVGMSKPAQDKNGNWFTFVSHRGKHKDGTSNAMIAGIINYGKSGQPPKPIISWGHASAVEPEVIARMQDEFERLTGGL